jgi:Xaa-Pro aminopeptidase
VCEVDGYAADVTRTFPVSGRFTAAQRAVYEVVLEAQRRAIAKVGPGVRFEEVHAASLGALVEGMLRLGWLKGEVEALIESKAYRPYFMHRTSHWLGLDVHDVGSYVVEGASRALEPGMVLTVEPGLYVSPEAREVGEEYRGIGVRIEDDVLVTPSGHEILTSATPKDVAEVEAACSR